MVTQPQRRAIPNSLQILHEIISEMSDAEKVNSAAFLTAVLNLDHNGSGEIPNPLNPQCLTFHLWAMKAYPNPGETREKGYKQLLMQLIK